MSRFLYTCVLAHFPMLFVLLSTLSLKAESGLVLHGAIVDDNHVIISWKVDHDLLDRPEKIVIRYNRSMVLNNQGEKWIDSDTIPYRAGYVQLHNLNAYTTYTYQLGYLPHS